MIQAGESSMHSSRRKDAETLADSGYTSTLTLFGASRSLMVGYYMFRGGSNPVNGNIG
jgi:hypothetical protein